MKSLPEIQHISSAALPYLLSVPLNNKPANGFPLICFLHGYDEAEPHNIFEALTKHGPLNPKNPPRVKQDFIIVAPQMPRAGDLWRQFSNQVYEIAENVQKDYNGDINRTYFTGFSFGGNGVFDVAEANPRFWAALWPVDLTRVPKNDPNRPVWISVET
uniref:Phospholipase/carboxylesterase/thioesterase domain-containing protein n=1 Tax=Panagrolaimus sp. PS1159 TaxID=55785 RepID=A0AC35GNL5_9BILA